MFAIKTRHKLVSRDNDQTTRKEMSRLILSLQQKKMMNFDYSQKYWNISEISRYYSGRIARPWYPEGSIPAAWEIPPPFMAFAYYLFSPSSPIKIATMIKHHILLLSLVPRQTSLPGYSLAPKAKLSSHVSIDTPTNTI